MATITANSSSVDIREAMEKEKQDVLDRANGLFYQRVVEARELTNPGPLPPGRAIVLIDGTERPGGLPKNVDLIKSRWW